MLMRRQHLQKAALQGQLKCRDFGKILEEEQLTPDAQMKSKAKEECNHDNKDFRGSTGTTWKWTCKDCGRGVTVAKLPEGNQRGRPRETMSRTSPARTPGSAGYTPLSAPTSSSSPGDPPLQSSHGSLMQSGAHKPKTFDGLSR